MGETEVTPVEIARLAGVGRAAVSNWRRRYDDFPQPAGGTTGSPTFALTKVEHWLRRHGKIADLPAEEQAWQHTRALSSAHDLADAVLRAGQFLFDRNRTDHSPQDRHPTAAHQSLATLAAEHGPAEAFETLLTRMHETTRLPRVPEEVANLMTAILEPETETIYDPACSTGGLLLAALARFPNAHLYGDEANPTLLDLAKLRLIAHHATRLQLRPGGLRHPPQPPLAADAAIAFAPHTERDWAGDNLAYDRRWEYGLPPKAEPELAWIQHALANLRAGGRAALLLPPAVAGRASGRRIRAELLRRGALRAVIALPPGAAHPNNLTPHLWLLHRPANGDRADHVLLGDLWAEDEPKPLAKWASAMREALHALERGDEPTTLAATMRAFRIIDLLDDTVDLTPWRRLRTELERVEPANIVQFRDSFAERLEQLVELLPALDTATTITKLPSIEVAELVRAGAVTLAVSGPIPEQAVTAQAGNDQIPVWRARDVVAGRGPEGHLPAARVPQGAVRTQVGDVVAPMMGRQLTALVVSESQTGAVLGPNLYLLRPDPALLDPWFLAGFLRRDSGTHRGGSLGSVHRYDIRRVEVPRIRIKDQRLFGELFMKLIGLDEGLRAAVSDSSDLIKLIIDGLAAGTLSPAHSRCRKT